MSLIGFCLELYCYFGITNGNMIIVGAVAIDGVSHVKDAIWSIRDDNGSNHHNYDQYSIAQNQWIYVTTQREAGVKKRFYINSKKQV